MTDLPSRKDTEVGAKLASENSRHLLDVSRRVAESGDYGAATSLAVLAGEESIKALALKAYSEGLPIPNGKQLRLILNQHEPRHLAAGMLAGAGEMVVSMIAAFFAAISGKQDGDDKQSAAKQWSRAAWWSDAGTIKNRGLYVEFEGRKWKTPADVSKADYDQALENAGGFVEFVEDILREGDPVARRGIVASAPVRLGQTAAWKPPRMPAIKPIDK